MLANTCSYMCSNIQLRDGESTLIVIKLADPPAHDRECTAGEPRQQLNSIRRDGLGAGDNVLAPVPSPSTTESAR